MPSPLPALHGRFPVLFPLRSPLPNWMGVPDTFSFPWMSLIVTPCSPSVKTHSFPGFPPGLFPPVHAYVPCLVYRCWSHFRWLFLLGVPVSFSWAEDICCPCWFTARTVDFHFADAILAHFCKTGLPAGQNVPFPPFRIFASGSSARAR